MMTMTLNAIGDDTCDCGRYSDRDRDKRVKVDAGGWDLGGHVEHDVDVDVDVKVEVEMKQEQRVGATRR